MTNFRLRKPNVIYKLAKHQPQTISNNSMSDELAIAFLKIRPERIDLFSKFPENWEELIGEKKESKSDSPKEENVETSSPMVVKKTSTNKKKPCTGCKEKRSVTPKNEDI